MTDAIRPINTRLPSLPFTVAVTRNEQQNGSEREVLSAPPQLATRGRCGSKKRKKCHLNALFLPSNEAYCLHVCVVKMIATFFHLVSFVIGMRMQEWPFCSMPSVLHRQ